MTSSISNNLFQMVLAQGNKEQNQHYAPHVFTAHMQLVSSFLKDELVKQYPTSQSIVDMLRPYMQIELVQVVNGVVKLPPTYRNFLGAGFYVRDLKDCEPVSVPERSFANPKKPTLAELAAVTAELQVESKHIVLKSIGEWNQVSTHPYKKPTTFKKAKGCIFDKTTLKVLPLKIPYVEVRFVKTTPDYFYGYTMLPDETFVFDQEKTVEELWEEAAIPYLFRGLNKLYANYVRDTEYIATAADLRDNSLF